MIAVDAAYCPCCGTATESRRVDGRDRTACPDCERVLWRNAVPSAGVAVVDDDRVCCIRRGRRPAEGVWALPGGHLEHDEPPAVGAARELEEETGLRVDPADLTVVGTGHASGPERSHVGIHFAVGRASTTGTLRPGDDAEAVQFMTAEMYEGHDSLVHDRGTVVEAIERF